MKHGGPVTLGAVRAGMGWTLATILGQIGVGIVLLAVLARLLPQAAFGVAGAALSVQMLLTLVADLGTASGLVQRPGLQRAHVATALWLALATGVLLAAVMAVTAPWAAQWFGMPELRSLLPVLSFGFVLSAWSAVSTNLMRREFRFRALAVAQLGSQLCGQAPTAIALALLGWQEWALVVAQLAQITMLTVLAGWLGPRLPLPRLHRGALRELLGFGCGDSLGRIAAQVATQADAWLVGGWFGPAALGCYQRAVQLLNAPANLLGTAVDKVAFPLLSGLQGDRERTRSSFLQAANLVSALGLPTAAVLFVLAPELVRVVLGPGWDDCVLPLRILCLGLPFRIGARLGAALARAQGAVYAAAGRQLLTAVLVVVGAVLARGGGLPGVAGAVVTAMVVGQLLLLQLCLGRLQLPWRAVVGPQLRHLLVAAGVLAAVAAAKALVPVGGSAWLVVGIVALAAVGGAAALLLCLPGLLRPELELLRRVLQRPPAAAPARGAP